MESTDRVRENDWFIFAFSFYFFISSGGYFIFLMARDSYTGHLSKVEGSMVMATNGHRGHEKDTNKNKKPNQSY